MGDMDAARFVDTQTPSDVGLHVILKDASISCSCFNGLDWVIEPLNQRRRAAHNNKGSNDRKNELLSGLVGDLDGNSTTNAAFRHIPLPEE